MATTGHGGRYITKKPCKACGVRTSALATLHVNGINLASDSPVYFHPRTGDLVVNCRICGVAKYASKVKGSFSSKHLCSAKCQSSTGFVCECSCAGKNHGASHAVVPS